MNLISGVSKLNRGIPEIQSNFDNAWDENHEHEYHTQIYTDLETYTDSKGNLHTRTVLRTRQVYDYSIHTYNYHPESGLLAEESLDELLSKIPESIGIKEKIHLASQLNEEGKIAAKESRKKEQKDLSETDLRSIANTWYTGATILKEINNLDSLWADMPFHAREWKEKRPLAKSTSYKTYSESDSGPEPYQAASKVESKCDQIKKSSSKILDTINWTKSQIPILKDNILKLTASESRDQKDLGRKVFEMTQEIYQRNFENGFEVDRFRKGMVFLWSFLGTIAGAAIGVAAAVGLELLEKRKSSDY